MLVKKWRTQVPPEPGQIEMMREQSGRTGVPIGEKVRRAIKRYFKSPANPNRGGNHL